MLIGLAGWMAPRTPRDSVGAPRLSPAASAQRMIPGSLGRVLPEKCPSEILLGGESDTTVDQDNNEPAAKLFSRNAKPDLPLRRTTGY